MTEQNVRLLKKLDRPPSGPNWVRFIRDEPTGTAKAIYSFVMGIPLFTYAPAYTAAKDRIEMGISRETAIRVASTKGSPLGRKANAELIEAFFAYDDVRRYSGANPVGFDREFFRVSRDVVVPVAPLSVIREKGKFVPIFLCGWSANPLTLLQRRLLMTIYDDAFLSLTDFQHSPAEMLFFPKIGSGPGSKRSTEVWHRGDYDLLSSSELNACVENFVVAREIARKLLIEQMDKARETSDGNTVSPDRDLFNR